MSKIRAHNVGEICTLDGLAEALFQLDYDGTPVCAPSGSPDVEVLGEYLKKNECCHQGGCVVEVGLDGDLSPGVFVGCQYRRDAESPSLLELTYGKEE